MTKLSTSDIACPNCNTLNNVEIYDSINVTLNPELKDRLLSGKLTSFKCVKCECETELQYPFLYHDMKKQFMVWLNFGDKVNVASVQQNPLLQELSKLPYQLRVVSAKIQLIEKILILDNNLDDKIIELMKIILRDSMRDDDYSEDFELLFADYTSEKSDEKVIVFIQQSVDYQKSFSVPFKTYLKFKDEMASKIKDPKEEVGQWLRVDENYFR